MKGLQSTSFQMHEQTGFYKGKVRDVYYFGNLMAMVTSDRISAFDVVMPVPIPHKGQILNEIAFYFLESNNDVAPNWTLLKPHPNVTLGKRLDPIPIEMVIRGYLAGHAWRVYDSGERSLCGVDLPAGLQKNDPLPEAIITPATKAKEGHDEDISIDEILKKGIVTKETMEQLETYTRSLFKRGQAYAESRGLYLVDTKYEFGIDPEDGQVYVIDEIHTPDSSRYFIKEGYEERQSKIEEQKQLSKEFVREWLMDKGFPYQTSEIPKITENQAEAFGKRYIELYDTLMPTKFIPEPYEQREENIRIAIETGIKGLR